MASVTEEVHLELPPIPHFSYEVAHQAHVPAQRPSRHSPLGGLAEAMEKPIQNPNSQ